MIAFCLERLGPRPRLADRRASPAARRQRRRRGRAGSSWRATSRTERSPRCGHASRSCTNVDLDHHATFGSRAEVARALRGWLANVPAVVRGEELAPSRGELAVAGEHNRRNAAAALAALELAGVSRDEAAARDRGVPRRSAAARAPRRGRRRRRLDDYAHHPAEIAATLAAVRNGERPRARALPAASLLADPASRPRARAPRSPPPTPSRDRDLSRRARSRSRA